ncbi:MAG: alpha-glucosidase/alpha-galactosidase [Oscillospiraceae bacterium]|nr:alpha-glucosidase/alpha-galactosidase [Oscillospiraceae bacterium]
MKFENGNARELQIAYIGGGSRGWAWGFMMDLADDSQMGGVVRLYDIDRKAAENNAVIGGKISAHPDAKAKWRYEVAGSLQDALTGADFVVISILPGTFDEMRSDVHAPEEYGFYQAVGDTVGPGGFIRAMRCLPMLVEIAEAIRDYSPKAWVINYTNPMTLCLRAMYDIFPEIRAFGCCHEVFGTQKLLAAMLEEKLGVKEIPRQDIKINVLGINHFTWISSASWQNMDLFPLYSEFTGKYHETGFAIGEDNWMNSAFHSANKIKMDLFRRFGQIAAAGDRHLAEFMPASWYLRDKETVASWKFGLTTVDWRVQDLKDRLARSAALISGEEAIEIKPSGEEGHLLIKALLGLGDIISNVNLPNKGQVSNLPVDVVVETNALFRRGEVLPVAAGAMPGNTLALTSRHVYNQENTLRAALGCDYSLALTTFLNDPLLEGITPADGEKLFYKMLTATRNYLPGGWKL